VAFYLVKRSDDLIFIGIQAIPKAKYENHNLSDADFRSYLDQIEKHMKTEKPHLEDKLTRRQLAGQINIPAHHLSMAINSQLGMNFWQYINKYRLQEAAGRLRNPEMGEMSILRIAYDSGFQSKASFNRQFKGHFKQTPAAFRAKTLDNLVAASR